MVQNPYESFFPPQSFPPGPVFCFFPLRLGRAGSRGVHGWSAPAAEGGALLLERVARRVSASDLLRGVGGEELPVPPSTWMGFVVCRGA